MKKNDFKYVLAFISLFVALLITSIMQGAFKESFFKEQYHKLQTHESMKMSEDDLMNATKILLDYTKDKQDNLELKVLVDNEEVEMFNQREKDHMIDVKNLYLNFNKLQYGLYFFSFIVLIYGFVKDDLRNRIKPIILNSLKYMAVVLAFLIIYALIDFDSFWTNFHLLFFTNDLWLLDPRTDRMINMFPLEFFNAMIFKIIFRYLVYLSVFSALFVLIRKERN